MSLDYINEAFRSLELLTEDMFKADSEGINELSDFMSSDVDNEEEISIIDMDAETEDDLQDSYVGKVIVDCNVCHSHVFKNKEDITLDDEGVVDIEEECPYCGENNGFVIIGEIHEFKPETAEEEIETDEEEIEETNDSTEESFTEATLSEDFQNENGAKAWASNIIKAYTDAAKNLGLDNFNMDSKGFGANEKAIISFKKSGKDFNKEVDMKMTQDVKSAEDAANYLKYEFADVLNEAFENENGTKAWSQNSINAYSQAAKKLGLDNFDMKTSGTGANEKATISFKKNGKDYSAEASLSDSHVKNAQEAEDFIRYTFAADLNESFKNVSLETDDQIMTMTSEDNGKVTVTTEPVENKNEGEVIAPISDETQSDIISANSEIVDEESPEEASEDSSEDALDFDIEEVDEESMSDLGESYLKKVYENVDSFKLTSCSTTPTQLILEGLITFKSGATKNTGFIFEAKDATKDGKVRFIGENAHLARGRKSFTLVGSMNENKLMCESFTYNYRAKNADGKSTRVYGKVNRNK